MEKALRILVFVSILAVAVTFTGGAFENSRLFPAGVCLASSPGMEQTAGTSQGTLKRYTDISSPWSGAYLNMDLTVEGSSEITESFSMGNAPRARQRDFLDTIFPPLPDHNGSEKNIDGSASSYDTPADSGSSVQSHSASNSGPVSVEEGNTGPGQDNQREREFGFLFSSLEFINWFALF